MGKADFVRVGKHCNVSCFLNDFIIWQRRDPYFWNDNGIRGAPLRFIGLPIVYFIFIFIFYVL